MTIWQYLVGTLRQPSFSIDVATLLPEATKFKLFFTFWAVRNGFLSKILFIASYPALEISIIFADLVVVYPLTLK